MAISHTTRVASVGIAGVNTRPLHAATLGIAGNWGSTLRPHMEQIASSSPVIAGDRLGDRAARLSTAFPKFEVLCGSCGRRAWHDG